MNSKHVLFCKNYSHFISHRIDKFFSFKFHRRKSTEIVSEEEPALKAKNTCTNSKSHKVKINQLFRNNPHLAVVRPHIPDKHLVLKRVTPPDNLYLIDSNVAKQAVQHIIPDIQKNPNQIVCETNAGLGLIASELLENGVKSLRLYESCPNFKAYLKNKFEDYAGRVELVPKDFFLIYRYDYIDKQDHGNRVEQLLEGVPKKNWDDDPAMTVIGPLATMKFIRYLIKSLVIQNVVASLGRIQMYVFMRPRDFIILSAGPHLNLHTYQRISVLFDAFFEYELLEKFPRKVFLPWQSVKALKTARYPSKIDSDCMYFVKIKFKRELPVTADNFLPLFLFVNQFFGRGTSKVVATIEKWIPGAGLSIMVPQLNHKAYFNNINIFTQFGELTPPEVLGVFKEVTNHPAYEKNHFISITESQLVKSDTIESSIDDHFTEKNIDKAENSDADIMS